MRSAQSMHVGRWSRSLPSLPRLILSILHLLGLRHGKGQDLFINVCNQSHPKVHESLEGRGSRWKLISNYILYIIIYIYNNIYLLYLIIFFFLKYSKNGKLNQNPDITFPKLSLGLILAESSSAQGHRVIIIILIIIIIINQVSWYKTIFKWRFKNILRKY